MTLEAGFRADRLSARVLMPARLLCLAACVLTACSRSAPDRSQQGRQAVPAIRK